jgi:hypothetical protein
MPGYSLQLTPDVKYLIYVGSAPREGDSIIANTGNAPILNLVPNTEHWSLTHAFLDALQGAKAGARERAEVTDVLTLQGAKLESPPTGFPVTDAYPTFILPTDVVWTAMTGAPSGDLWLGRATGTAEGVSEVGIDFARLVPPSETGAWSGSVTWYARSSSARQPSGPVVGDGTTTLSYTTVASAEAGVFWFSVTLRPQAPPSS